MKKPLCFFCIMIGCLAVFAQQDTNSYESRFSRASNHYREGNFSLALEGYKQLFSEYPEIGELSTKIGNCYLRLEQFDSAKTYFIRTLAVTPNDLEALTKLAFIAGIEGKTDSAIYIYKQIIEIEPTYAEAYAGIGKMYYWKNKPKSALHYYDKALQLDPTNSDYLTYRKMIKKELAYQLTATVMYVSEREETYQISALIQRYGVEKRFCDYFSLSVNTLWDYSLRNNVFESDVRRWFDNSWLKANFIFKNQLISVFAGASGLENRFTSYGISWHSTFAIKKLQIKNYFTAAYDYYYYWNDIGHDYYQDMLRFSYKKLTISAMYRYSVVRNKLVWTDVGDEITNNPAHRVTADVNYAFFENPKLIVGLNYTYMDYKYASPLYYSPMNRHVAGLFISDFYRYKKFYTYQECSFGYDMDKFVQIAAGVEAGFDLGKISLGLSGNYFYNKYYQNFSLLFTVKMNL